MRVAQIQGLRALAAVIVTFFHARLVPGGFIGVDIFYVISGYLITGLILQRQTGANMVAVLENLSLLVRERLNMAAKMKAHTAQQRFSAGILCALPLVVGLGFWVQKPEYMKLLWTDPLGSKFFTYAVISEVVGILVIRKMASVKF